MDAQTLTALNEKLADDARNAPGPDWPELECDDCGEVFESDFVKETRDGKFCLECWDARKGASGAFGAGA